jgi:hypothetical protein
MSLDKSSSGGGRNAPRAKRQYQYFANVIYLAIFFLNFVVGHNIEYVGRVATGLDSGLIPPTAVPVQNTHSLKPTTTKTKHNNDDDRLQALKVPRRLLINSTPFLVHTMAAAPKNRSVYIKTTYWIAGDNPQTRTERFDPSNVQAARVGLPLGTEPVKPEAGDFSYSGMHDQGPLPPSREGGDVAVLIGCAEKAKKFNDEYMTLVIKGEKKQKAQEENGHPIKKTKTAASEGS